MPYYMCSLLTKKKYSEFEGWFEFFNQKKTLHCIPYSESWCLLFAVVTNDPKFKKINDALEKKIRENNKLKIYPHPEFVFEAFRTPHDNVKVVFIGQDPYFNCEYIDNRYVPQAMGLSFSVPHDILIPVSLKNIYANLLKFGHIKKIPDSGNLWFWAEQGCLMLNTALTVEDGKKKSHTKLWEWFTKYTIKYISDNMNDIIFVMWGGDAYQNADYVDLDKHHIIVSSHPSGLSVNKSFRDFPAFSNQDHFGMINSILEKTGRDKILWE